MDLKAQSVVSIFQDSIKDWHKEEKPSENPYPSATLDHLLYKKNQIDTIQWHIEDEIRRPDLPADKLVGFKRQIDRLNQERTDTVELIDDAIANLCHGIEKKPGAKMNSETPAWLIDRMSILELKIYHMQEQTERKDASAEHLETCKNKLSVLLEQRKDLTQCLDELLDDIKEGQRYFKVYRQMKMYNDKNLNPALYSSKK